MQALIIYGVSHVFDFRSAECALLWAEGYVILTKAICVSLLEKLLLWRQIWRRRQIASDIDPTDDEEPDRMKVLTAAEENPITNTQQVLSTAQATK